MKRNTYCCAWYYRNDLETFAVDSYIKPCEITMLYIPTTWRRKVVNIHIVVVEVITSLVHRPLHTAPMCRPN